MVANMSCSDLRMIKKTLVYSLTACFLSLSSGLAIADDWPQILGPNRNGQAQNEALADSWPNTGPKNMWSKDIGAGYAGPAIANGKVLIFHRQGASELLEALDLKTGKRIWSTDYQATYQSSIDPDSGPRCVPLVVKDKVYVFGAAADLHCANLADGKKLWTVNLGEKYSASEGYFGTGSTPIHINGKILVNLGGRNEAGIVALDAEKGKVVWTKTGEAASYSSPTLAVINGKTWVIFITRMNVVAIDPETGDQGFSFPFGARGPTVNAASPLILDDLLFVTASYGVGAKLVKIRTDDVLPVWENDDTLSSQYNTPVIHNGHLFGIHGRADIGVAELRCVDLKTGKIKWTRDNFYTANLILADNKLIAITNRKKGEAEAFLIAADSKAYKELGSFHPFQDVPRALPALSGGYLVARDTGNNGGALKCFYVGK